MNEKAVGTVPSTRTVVDYRERIASGDTCYYSSYSSASTDDGFNVVVPAAGAEGARPTRPLGPPFVASADHGAPHRQSSLRVVRDPRDPRVRVRVRAAIVTPTGASPLIHP